VRSEPSAQASGPSAQASELSAQASGPAVQGPESSVAGAQPQAPAGEQPAAHVDSSTPSEASAIGASSAAAAPEGPAVRTAGDFIAAELAAFAERIALERGTRVEIKSELDALDELGAPQRRTIKNVLIQLVRNSVAHGIEPPEERTAAGKDAAGRLSISALRDEAGALRLNYSDDGRGLDPDLLRAHAVASGIISDRAQLDDASAIGLIFQPGFTTAEAADEVAGRGVGMDIIKQHVVDEARGEIGIRSDPGRYLEFELTFPAFDSVPA
jgi:signal transduction histidine kinase